MASLIHFTLTIAAMGVFFTSIGEFEESPGPPSTTARVAEGAIQVLMSPGGQLWGVLQPPGTHLPDLLEHIVFVGNSALWGGTVSAIIGVARKRQGSNA